MPTPRYIYARYYVVNLSVIFAAFGSVSASQIGICQTNKKKEAKQQKKAMAKVDSPTSRSPHIDVGNAVNSAFYWLPVSFDRTIFFFSLFMHLFLMQRERKKNHGKCWAMEVDGRWWLNSRLLAAITLNIFYLWILTESLCFGFNIIVKYSFYCDKIENIYMGIYMYLMEQCIRFRFDLIGSLVRLIQEK